MDKQEQNTSAAPDSTPESPVSEGKLNSAKQKLGALADKAKQHDFKGDAKAAAESAKALKESLKKHDFKAELKEAFAEARKSPASIWKKPETPRPGKELAVVGFAVAIILFILSIPFSGAVLGLVFLILSVAALLLCLLGLKTEGRKLAIGGTAVGLLVIFCSLGQIFGSSNRGEEDAEDATSKVAVTNEQESKVVKEYPLLSEAVTNEQESTNVDEYPLLIENEGEEASNVEEILEMAENAKKMESLNFYGFYTGMSFKNAKKLRSHYELNKKQLWFKWSKENGEVYGMYFTPKALAMIMDVANNFETVELTMQHYLGIVTWNNEKEVTKGEVDSLFQDDTDKLLWGDAANVARWYKTADGVLAKLSPTGWNSSGKAVFTIWDPRRGNPGQKFNNRFDNNKKMRKARVDLIEKGIKTRLLKLPQDYECLLKESDGCWKNVYEISKENRIALFGKPSDSNITNNRKGIYEIDLLVESLNSMSSELKGDLCFAADDGVFFFAGPKDKMDVLAQARKDKTTIRTLERDYHESWRKYKDSREYELVAMNENEYKEVYFARHGFILENGQYRRGTEEKLAKVREPFWRRRKEAVDKAKAEEDARKAAIAKWQKEQRDKEEIAKAKEAAEKSKSYMDEVSSYKEGVFDYGSSLGKKDQRKWQELADQAQKSADYAQAKIKDAEEHPESGWDVNILTTQYNNAIQERDSHLRRVEDVKANRAKYFLDSAEEAKKKKASRMEKVAKNAMSEADRLAKTGPEKAVQFWKEVTANATAAAQDYQKLIPEFTKAAAELTEKSNAGQESK